MDKIDMQELNDAVMAGVAAIGIIAFTVGLLYFGLALGY